MPMEMIRKEGFKRLLMLRISSVLPPFCLDLLTLPSSSLKNLLARTSTKGSDYVCRQNHSSAC
mgnify:CR=1 FL=1